MFFKKEVVCDKCGVSVHKKLIGDFDATHQGKHKDGFRLRLCKSCMSNALIEQLLSFDERAVIVHPSVRYKTYAFYQFDELLTSSKHSIHRNSDIEFMNDLKKLLPPDKANCHLCTDVASYTWIPLTVFDNNPFNWYVNKELNHHNIYLCNRCLTKAFRDKVQEDNITFTAIYPPRKGEGFATPWEV